MTAADTTPVDKSARRVRGMFAEIASRYDFLNHLLSFQIDHYWRWRTVRRVRPEGDSPILDVCTGTGDLVLAYARKAKGQTPIVGADFCRPMLEIGARKCTSRGVGRVTFVEADATCLPFSSDSFQIVSVAFGLRNVADTALGLAEMTRVCQPGGRVAVLEFSSPTWQPFKAIYGWYFRHVLPRIGAMLARNQSAAYNYLPESVGQFPSGQQLARLMEAAGLEQVAWQGLTLGVATLYVGRKPGCGTQQAERAVHYQMSVS